MISNSEEDDFVKSEPRARKAVRKESSDNESVEVSIVISSSEEDFVESEPKARKASHSKKMIEEEGSYSDSPVVAPSRNLVSKKNRFVEDEGSDSSEEDSFEEIGTGRKDGRKISRKIEQILSEDDENIEDEESGNLNRGQCYS